MTFGSSGIEKLKQRSCHLRKYVFYLLCLQVLVPCICLQPLRAVAFPGGEALLCRLHTNIQKYIYMYGKLILIICLSYEMFTVIDKTFGLLSDYKSVHFLEFLIYSGCFFRQTLSWF